MNECEYFMHIYKDYRLQWSKGIDYMMQMELLTPATDYFSQNGYSEKELLVLGMDICRALIYMESKGLSHNDINSDNVYRSDNGTYKLGDLGMTREISVWSAGAEFPVNLVTSTERDIYSLGVMLYILAGGDKNGIQNCFPADIEHLPRPRNMGMEFFNVILSTCRVLKSKRIENASEMLKRLQKVSKVSEKIISFVKNRETDENLFFSEFYENEASVKQSTRFSQKKTFEENEEYFENGESPKSSGDSVDHESYKSGKNGIHKVNYKAMYRIGCWTLFTCLVALIPLTIFSIMRICFKPDLPYINKLIMEMLYLALTLSITTIKDLTVLNLRQKEKFVFDFALFLSIIILIFTAMLFGIMTAKDMDLLQKQISDNMNTSVLLVITLLMVIWNIIIGISIQVAASDD